MPHVEVVEQPKISQTEEEKEAELGLETAPGTVLGQEEVTVMEGEEPKTVLYTRVRGIGDFSLAYDAETFSAEASADSLTFQAALLGELGRRWTAPIRDEIGRCEQAAQSVGRLAWELSLAAGDKNDTTAESARTQFYFTIDQPFRLWLQSIDPETDKLDEKADEWQEKARKLAAELGRQMVERAGNAAFVGHRVEVKTGGKKDEKKTVLYTAPKAYNSFLYNLRKLYPKKEGGTA